MRRTRFSEIKSHPSIPAQSDREEGDALYVRARYLPD